MLRALSGLSRHEFFEKIGISASTMDTWESGRVELAQKSAERVCEAFKKVGVFCSAEWILDGSGVPPRIMDTLERTITNAAYLSVDVPSHFGGGGGVTAPSLLQFSQGLSENPASSSLSKNSHNNHNSDSFHSVDSAYDGASGSINLCSFVNFPSFIDAKIKEELCFFLTLNPGALYHVVSKDCFGSRFKEGDCLAGIPKTTGVLQGEFVIIALENGNSDGSCPIFGRLLKYDERKGSCSLEVDQGSQLDIQIQSPQNNKIAGVVWHRATRSLFS